MGCIIVKQVKRTPGYEEPTVLASETSFTISEVEILYELFKKISSLIYDDGLIHKEELQIALFKNSNRRNLFADRAKLGNLLNHLLCILYPTLFDSFYQIFDSFDLKRNGVIEFGEFVRSLSVFHPDAPKSEKISFAFNLYDLRQTGFIERDELKEMVIALLNESDLHLSDDEVETIVDQTFNEADIKGDGKIDIEEWKDFVKKKPSSLKIMTLPYLKDISLAFPSFVVHPEVEDDDITGI